jgi:hypothetical protein
MARWGFAVCQPRQPARRHAADFPSRAVCAAWLIHAKNGCRHFGLMPSMAS